MVVTIAVYITAAAVCKRNVSSVRVGPVLDRIV
jgi:hypothetical protein